MIPLLQNDYYKYSQMFRGNFLKGAALFRSFLNDPVAKEHILSSVPALSAVFTDCTKTEAIASAMTFSWKRTAFRKHS